MSLCLVIACILAMIGNNMKYLIYGETQGSKHYLAQAATMAVVLAILRKLQASLWENITVEEGVIL